MMAVLTLMLSACGGINDSSNGISEADLETTDDRSIWNGEGAPFAYQMIVLPPNNNTSLLDIGLYQEELYFIETDSMSKGYRLIKEGKTVFSSSSYYYSSSPSPAGIWILENEYFNDESHYKLIQISDDGMVLFEIDLSSICKEDRYLHSLSYSKGTLFCISGSNHLVAVSEGGQFVSSVVIDGDQAYTTVGTNGTLYVVQEKNNKESIFELDSTLSELNFAFECEVGIVFDGGTKYQLLLSTTRGLYSVEATGKTTPLVIWKECSICLNGLYKIVVKDSEHFMCFTREGVGILSSTTPEEVNHKIELKLATINSTKTLQTIVSRFNRENKRYYVRIVDYSEDNAFSTEDATLRLNTDIISGNLPDLISFKSISPFPFVRKGLLSDISVLFLDDEEIEPEDIAIWNALAAQGGVYYISGSFNLETLVGRYSDFGDRFGWSLDEYLRIEQKTPSEMEIIHNMTRESFIDCIASRYIRMAINWESGSCDFESPEFISILEAGSRIRETPEDPNNLVFGYGPVFVGEGSRVASLSWVEDVWKLSYEEFMAGVHLSFIGWPTIDGSCGSDVHLIEPIGVFDRGSNKTGSWEFIKFMIQNVEPEDRGLPVYLPALKREIDVAIKNENLPVRMTPADGERLLQLISKTENISIYDEIVLNIIREESAAFFCGNKTSSEAAALIQSRVQIYISEQS